MPLLKVEDVYSLIITDEKVRDHIRRSELLRSRMGFRDYAANFGIHDLGEVSDAQLFSLVAARNTAPLVDLLRIPSGKDRSGASAYANYDLHRPKTSLGPATQSFLASPPNTDQEWEILRDPQDIAQALPEDLLLRRRAPKEFLRRLTEGELLRQAWIQDDLDDQANAPIESPEVSTKYDQLSAKDDARPFGYLLLDASESMGTGRDRRGEVARGLALAYLLSQFESGNPTHLYLFRHELSPVFGGDRRSAFEAAVSAVLSHSYEGMTNLQGALKLLSGVMQAQHKRVDIALITDGVTRLTENPLGKAHLHTFLVGVRPEEFDGFSAAQYQESIITLQGWSDFMFRITPAIMATASIPRKEDVMDFGKILYGLEAEVAGAASPEKVRRIQARLQNLSRIISRYQSNQSMPDKEVEALAHETHAAIAKYGQADPIEISMKNATQWSPLDRDLMVALEIRELKNLLDPPTLTAKWGLKIIPQNPTTIWEVLKLLWKAIRRRLSIRRIRSKLRRMLDSRRPVPH